MIFSILQVSRDHKRLLTASVRHFFSVVYCNKGHCPETVKFNGCTRERPLFIKYNTIYHTLDWLEHINVTKLVVLSLKQKQFTLTMDTIRIVLLKLI